MRRLLIICGMVCALSAEAATIVITTNWSQFPTAVPSGGDVILMQKGGINYYFTPNQLAVQLSTNESLIEVLGPAGVSNALYAIETVRNAAVSNALVALVGSSGGGDVTTAQLNTASNLLYSTETTRNAAVSNSVVALELIRNAAVSNAVIAEIVSYDMAASNLLYATETTRNAAVSNAVVALIGAGGGVNLIQNGSFEVWDNGVGPSSTAVPSKWRYGGNESLERNGTNRLFGAYCLRFANIGGGGIIGEIYQNIALLTNDWTQGGSWNVGYWNGKTVTFSCWVFATNANRVKLVLNDDVTQTFSSYHTGSGGWQLLSVTKTMSAVSTAFQVAVFIEAGADTVYADVDGAMLKEGQLASAFSDAPLVLDNASSDPGLLITTTFGGPIVAGGISLTTTGVSHGVTTYVSNSTFSSLGAISPIYGGLVMWAISDFDYNSFQLYGVIGTNNPTDTLPAILLTGAKKNTTEPQALSAAETVLQIANWETTLMTVMGSGNVGINTVTPTNALDVNGHASIRSKFFLPNLPTNGSPVAFLATDAAGAVYETATVAGAGGSTTNASQFGASVELTIKDGTLLTNLNVKTGSATALTVDTNVLVVTGAKVGIGTAAPTTKFANTDTAVSSANGGLSASALGASWKIPAGAFNTGFVMALENAQTAAANINSGLLIKIGSFDASDRPLSIQTGGTNRFEVIGNGNVGIGTNVPALRLDVVGGIRSHTVTASRVAAFHTDKTLTNALTTTAALDNFFIGGISTAPTNTAAFTITTNNFTLDTYYTNSGARAWVSASIGMTNVLLTEKAWVGLYLDQDGDGTWERTGINVRLQGISALAGVEQLNAFLQPSARFIFTNLGTVANASIEANSSQWVRQ